MSLPAEGHLREGHLLLRWSGSAAPEASERLVDLEPHRAELEAWWACGAQSGVRALASLAERPKPELASLALSTRGPGSGLTAVVARALGIGTVHHEEDTAQGSDHFALLGCDGKLPAMDECQAVARDLRPEGWLTLFGLPHQQLSAAFEPLARAGFVLRSSGRIDEWSYLSGSILRLSAFLR